MDKRNNAVTPQQSDQAIIEQYLRVLWLEKGLSANTRLSYRRDLNHFAHWLNERNFSLLNIERQQVQYYLDWRVGQAFKAVSTARVLSCLRGFYHYLLRDALIERDPMSNIESPKPARPLPKLLSEEQVRALLAAPVLSDVLGLRDRAMLEMLYATGLRISELVSLTHEQINTSVGVIRIRGKGDKERLVPVGDEALHWLKKYQHISRPQLIADVTAPIVFVSQQGKMMTRQTFWHRIKYYARLVHIDAALSPHTLRHAFATHLLNHGADLRVVQLLLGHADLSTTQIYTHIASHRLQTLHQQHHPRG